MKIAVIGGGSWGTTLADLLAKKGEDARLWVREQAVMHEIRTARENSWYLPGRKLSERLEVSTDAAAVADDAKPFHLRRALPVHPTGLPALPANTCRRIRSSSAPARASNSTP